MLMGLLNTLVHVSVVRLGMYVTAALLIAFALGVIAAMVYAATLGTGAIMSVLFYTISAIRGQFN